VVPLADWRPNIETQKRGKKDQKLSELGHGMIPGEPDEAIGGVSVRQISRVALLSLTGLARYRFPLGGSDVTVPGRVVLAALALVADRLAFGGAGLHLRSGTDLVRTHERIEWVRAGGATEPLDLPVERALELLDSARARLADAGLSWEPEPVILLPSSRLREVIERTFLVPSIESDA
jgi:CRISPR-associated protein Csb1